MKPVLGQRIPDDVAHRRRVVGVKGISNAHPAECAEVLER